MATMPAFAAAGYQFEATPDLSKLETRERLSQSAMDGLFAIADKWQLQWRELEICSGECRVRPSTS
jgi:hypothetical protein